MTKLYTTLTGLTTIGRVSALRVRSPGAFRRMPAGCPQTGDAGRRNQPPPGRHAVADFCKKHLEDPDRADEPRSIYPRFSPQG
jgi:hypothetical protein